MTRKSYIKQSHAEQLLKTASEFVVELRSKGFHLKPGNSVTDADTGKPIYGTTNFDKLQDVILKIRKNYAP